MNSPDFAPSASLDMLRERATLLRQVRRFFDERDFLEVETPLLSADTVVDRHIEPLAVTSPGDTSQATDLWLQTSPEFAMKRLLASGAEAIYQICKCFRGAESGSQHNLEFTMVEWYRVGDGYADGIELLDQFAQQLLGAEPAERITYREAFERELQLDPHACDIQALAARAAERSLGVDPGYTQDRDEWLNLLLAECVQPQLGRGRPTILLDYPASQSALAKVRLDSPSVAERFELFYEGIELANGYHELTDADELRRRNAAVNQQRVADGHRRLPEASRLLEAMEAGLPDCSGCALGFDRLLMAKTGADSIEQVIAFPSDRA